ELVVGPEPCQMAVGDFNGDAITDLVVTEFGSNSVRLLRGVRTPPLPLGAPCFTRAQCISTFCVDGVCCDMSSCPSGEACNILPNRGHCSPPAGNGNLCTSPAQCQSGNCVD